MIIYKEGELVKYIVLASLTFAPHFNYVTLDYLALLQKLCVNLIQGFLTQIFVIFQSVNFPIY